MSLSVSNSFSGTTVGHLKSNVVVDVIESDVAPKPKNIPIQSVLQFDASLYTSAEIHNIVGSFFDDDTGPEVWYDSEAGEVVTVVDGPSVVRNVAVGVGLSNFETVLESEASDNYMAIHDSRNTDWASINGLVNDTDMWNFTHVPIRTWNGTRTRQIAVDAGVPKKISIQRGCTNTIYAARGKDMWNGVVQLVKSWGMIISSDYVSEPAVYAEDGRVITKGFFKTLGKILSTAVKIGGILIPIVAAVSKESKTLTPQQKRIGEVMDRYLANRQRSIQSGGSVQVGAKKPVKRVRGGRSGSSKRSKKSKQTS